MPVGAAIRLGEQLEPERRQSGPGRSAQPGLAAEARLQPFGQNVVELAIRGEEQRDGRRGRGLVALVGVGGALIGVGGLLLSFLKAGKPILSRETILKILPGLLLLMTICFVAGFAFG